MTDSHTSVLGLREIVKTKKIIPILRDELEIIDISSETGNNLIAFPAQCNFNGTKYPLSLIEKYHKHSRNYVLLDAASFVSTCRLDLSVYKPDYVCMSFYKIFGYPTGLGALLVSKRGAQELQKHYYGGGTVKIALTRTNWHQKRDSLQERFEDGTIDFLGAVALQTCFKYMEDLLGLSFSDRVARHVFNLGAYLFHNLKALTHYNGKPVVELYHSNNFDNIKLQGGTVNFNIMHADGSYVGYGEFACIATLHNIVIRTSCFCNPGSCQTYLKLTHQDLMKQFNSGHICGDFNDLVDGAPTGSIRVSFSYMTTKENVDKLIEVVKSYYMKTSSISDEVRKPYKLDTRLVKTKPTLKCIRIFPIKSCGPMKINDKWQLNNKGFKYDREWMIINGTNGTAFTQKNEPTLCMIRPYIDEEEGTMRLDFPEVLSIEVPLEMKGARRDVEICTTKVCGKRVEGYDCGDEVAQWLSDVLGAKDLRLIRQTAHSVTQSGENISLSNQAQFLLISEPSVRWLMDQVDEWDSQDNVEHIVDRFRGNLIIDNCVALIENEWKAIKIGSTELQVQGPCSRCQMICIDQNTGEKTLEPLRTIAKIFKGKMRFGIYLKQLNPDQYHTINCGDEINLF